MPNISKKRLSIHINSYEKYKSRRFMDIMDSTNVLGEENAENPSNQFSQGNQKLALYNQISVIGLCEYGDIRFCQDKISKSPFAMKIIHKHILPSDQEAVRLCGSLNKLFQLSHPFILHIHDIFQDTQRVYVVSDFCAGGNLYNYLQTFGRLNELHVRFIAIQLLIVLQYLHDQHILYCNLIGENILLDEQGYIHLTGFTQSLFDLEPPYYNFVGVTECLSPEMLLNRGIDERHDYWMLGCLLYELLEGELPFQRYTVSQTIQAILLGDVQYTYASPAAQQFINSLLIDNPDQRLGVHLNTVRQHEFLRGMDWEGIEMKTLPSPFARMSNTNDPLCFCNRFKEDIVEKENNNVDYHNSVFTSMLS